jgi:hypothetical protein
MAEHQTSLLQFGQAHWTFDVLADDGPTPFGVVIDLDRMDCSPMVANNQMIHYDVDAREFSRIILSCLVPYRWTRCNVHPIGYFAFVDTREVITAHTFPLFSVPRKFIPLVLGKSYTEPSARAYLESLLIGIQDAVGAIQYERKGSSLHCFLSLFIEDRLRFYYVELAGTATCMTVVNAIVISSNLADLYVQGDDDIIDMDPKALLERLVSDLASLEDYAGLHPYEAFDVVPQSGLTPPRQKLCRMAGAKSSNSPGHQPVFPIPPEPLDNEGRRKARDLTKKRRRDAKANRNIFRPQGFFDILHPKVQVDEELQDTLETFTDHAEKFNGHLPELKRMLGELTSNGIQVKVGLDTSVIHVPALIGLVSVAYMANSEGGNWKGALAAYGVSYVSTCAYSHRDWLMTKLGKIFSKDRVVVSPQSFDFSLIEELSGAILGYLALISAKAHVATSGKIASIAKSLSTFDRTKTGLSNAVAFGVRLVERLINWFRDNVLGLPRISLLESSIPELQSWTNKVDIVADEAHRGVLYINSANSARIHALKMEGNQLSAKKFSASDSAQVRSALNTYLHTLRKISIPFDQANFTGNGARMEPVVVLLSGVPGIGKTWALLPLIMDVLREVLPPDRLAALKDDFNNEIFARYPETKFWEGYRGQMACIFDDFGQARDMAGQPDNEYVELIRAANIFPYLLHMAGIEAKGCTNFNSRLLFCTTNTVNFDPRSITEPEAVMRRFDIIVSVYPKAEYCVDPEASRPNRRLDKKLAGPRFSEDIYEFCIKKADGCTIGHDVLETLTFRELRDRIVKMYLERSKRADDYIADLSARAHDLLFEPQGAENSTVQMEELTQFDSAFDASCAPEDLSSATLEDLLAEPVDQPPQLMNPVDLYRFLKGKQDFDVPAYELSMKTLGYRSPGHVHIYTWMAYRRNPSAFMECVDRSPPLLPKLVFKLAHFSNPQAAPPPDDLGNLAIARRTLHGYWEKAKSFLIQMKDKFMWLSEWQRCCVIGSILGLGIRCILDKYDMLPTWCGSKPAQSSDASPESGGPRDRQPKFSVAKVKPSPSFRPEGGLDETAQGMVNKAIVKCSYRMTVPAMDNKQLGYATFVKGKIMVMPWHFVAQLRALVDEYVEDTDQIIMENSTSGSKRPVTIRQVLDGVIEDPELLKRDLCLVDLDLHQHPDITSYFVQEKQLTFSVIPSTLYGLRKNPDGVWSAHAPARREKSQFVNSDLGDYTVQDVLKYHMPTVAGDCGALLVAQSPGFGPGKFLGFHVAGSQNAIGFSSIVTYEILMRALERAPPQLPPPVNGDLFNPQCAEFPVEGHFLPLVKIDQAVSQPMRSRIVPSVFHNLWTESPYAPPRLRPFMDDGQMKDPALMAIQRYGVDPVLVDPLPLKLAADYIASQTAHHVVGGRNPDPRILTFEEAVLGLPEEKYCKSIPRGTSAGYPYILKEKPGHRGKERFFGKEADFDLNTKECAQLKKECLEIIEKARNGERSEVVYVDFLKDETRKHERVKQGNTRLISAAPVAYTIVCRMYFLSFVMAVMSAHLMVGIGVGVNCYSNDWDLLARSLKSKGLNIIAGDFKGFDTSHFEVLANFVLVIIERYYNGCEPSVREVLFTDLTNSVHIIRDLIYQWCLGRLPSGHPLTAIFSSFMNRILYVACWIVLHPNGEAGLSDFDRHVYLCTYGDDSICSVSDWALEFFNYRTIAKVMSSFGYTYTDEMKTSEDEGPLARSLDQVTFLKRHFRYEPIVGRYVAPLRLEAIIEMLYWTQRGHNGAEISRANVENALRELSLHDRSTFESWAPKVIAASRELLDFHPAIVDYRALQRIACGLQVVW